jgi:hypothetical protein
MTPWLCRPCWGYHRPPLWRRCALALGCTCTRSCASLHCPSGLCYSPQDCYSTQTPASGCYNEHNKEFFKCLADWFRNWKLGYNASTYCRPVVTSLPKWQKKLVRFCSMIIRGRRYNWYMLKLKPTFWLKQFHQRAPWPSITPFPSNVRLSIL